MKSKYEIPPTQLTMRKVPPPENYAPDFYRYNRPPLTFSRQFKGYGIPRCPYPRSLPLALAGAIGVGIGAGFKFSNKP